MYRPSPQPRLEGYQYNPQPAEDHEDDHVREKKSRTDGRRNKATYRPTPLTWPFISVLILLIAAAIGLILFVRQTKPNSDDEAHIQSRSLNVGVAGNVRKAPIILAVPQQEASSSLTTTSPQDDESPSNGTPGASLALRSVTATLSSNTSDSTSTGQQISTPAPTSDGESDAQLRASTTVITSCNPQICVLEEIVVSYYETTTTRSEPSSSSSQEPSPIVSTYTTTVVHGITTSASAVVTTATHVTSIPLSTATLTFSPTNTVPYANSSTVLESPSVSESTIYTESTIIETITVENGEPLSSVTEVETVVTTIFPSETTLLATGVPSTGAAIYIETGSTTLYKTHTIPNPSGKVSAEVIDITIVEITDEAVTHEVTIDGNTVVTKGPDQVVTQPVTLDPTTVVSEVEESVAIVVVATTISANGPVTRVVETRVGGELSTVVQQQQPQTIVSTIGGVAQTVVTTPPAQTITSRVGGTVVSVATATSVDAAGETVTLYGETTTGGSVATFVTQPPPETLVQTVGGVETTVVTTPEAQTVTTMVGGTLMTMTTVSTPTGAIVSTYTTSSSVSGYLTTIVSTPSPTSIVTTISGKLTTIVSTPSVTTIVSTSSGTSYTSTVTSTTAPTESPGDAVVVTAQTVAGFTAAEYFAGKFLPALYAIGLAVILRIIDMNAKLYQPFHALSDPAGAFGQDSLNLQYSGLFGFVTPVITLAQGHPIPFITTLCVMLASFLVPLSSEAIGIKLTGTCQITAIENCAGRLGVSPSIAVILVAVLGAIIVLLLLLIFFLRRYDTGLHSNPWSIAGIASLATNPELRINGANGVAIKASLADKRFGLGSFENSRDRDDYGIVLVDESGRQLTDGSDHDDEAFYQNQDGGGETDPATGNKRHDVPFMALSWLWRLAFMAVLLTMFGLTLYYHLTATKSNPFRDWIQGQTFGVRFLFAGVGVVVAMCFFAFFSSVALISPYANMHHRSQPPDKSILLTRPTNAFFGIYTAIKRGDIFLMAVALMAIFTEFLPIILVNVPYSLTQTRTTHVVCTRMTMAILMGDVIMVFASLFRKWPHMPADPRSVAGAMYYVVESNMLRDFEGTSDMRRKERDTWLKEKGRRYFYGETPGRAGGYRMSVEGDSVTGTTGLDRIKTKYQGYEGT